MSVKAKPRYPFLALGLPLILILLVGFGPIVILLTGGMVADALGCTMPISDIAPCPFMGVDLSGMLALAVLFGYLAFITIPMGTTGLAIWFGVAILVTLVWWVRRRRAA